jgi:CRISPR-associated exonuclease Cas4
LVGIADVVEFHRADNIEDKAGIELPDTQGRWWPFIVEYKRGLPKPDRRDEVQLCAQAMCLEEMINVEIASSAFFYGKPRRRDVVKLDNSLREETENVSNRLHELIDSGKTPLASYGEKCQRCSLIDLCLPKISHTKGGVENYLRRAIHEGATE